MNTRKERSRCLSKVKVAIKNVDHLISQSQQQLQLIGWQIVAYTHTPTEAGRDKGRRLQQKQKQQLLQQQSQTPSA